ncbi:uncharacterized protein [Rutidosis leptorrhynchoides]|uniref:uncharacterized protein isoform X2 n=1 Tax=Rutidosis leptorrhynchoides TaxID=125765 RepID=UPI003A99FC15
MRMSRPASSFGQPKSTPVMVKVRLTCVAAGFGSESGQLVGDVERKPKVVAKAAIHMEAAINGSVVAPSRISEKADLATLMLFMRTTMLHRLKVATRPRPWSLIIQSSVEKGVFLVMESYLQYFQAIYHHSDHGHIMHLLIEALDMFLVGTAMLTFGMGLHVMFVGSRASEGNLVPVPQSNFFGLFHLKEIPSWAGMKSMSQGKSKIGHALMLLLQAGVLEKFKSIPLVTGLDMACFAAAVFVSSAGLFILSRLSIDTSTRI